MNIWDEKAKNYARYEENPSQAMQEFFAFFKEIGLELEGKKILDLGGGTGVVSLHLAKLAKSVTVVDSSHEMLEILRADSLQHGIKNISCINTSFNEYEKKEDYDLVFSSMCPILNEAKDYERFLNLAPRRIYINFAARRVSSFLDPIFAHFKSEPKDFGKDDLEVYLNKLGLPYMKKVFDEVRVMKRSFDKALATAIWHLKINKAEFDEDELKGMIPASGVEEEVKSKLKCLVL